MEIIETRIDELTREFRIAVPAAEIQRKFETRLSKLARTVRMPGFRPGKVPLSLLRKRYGEALRNEVVEEAIDETSKTLISERGLRPAMPPKVAVASASGESDLEYVLAVEELPEITPPNFSAIALERLVADVDDGDIEQMLQRLAENMRGSSEISEPRPATSEDIVVFDVISPEDRAPFGNGQDIAIAPGKRLGLPGLEEQLIGASVGETKSITIAFPPEFPMPSIAGRRITYKVMIKQLRCPDPMAIDDALAIKLGAENLQQLKQRVREHREQELRAASRMRLKRALLDRLDEQYSFAVPKSLVERELNVITGQLRSSLEGETEASRGADAEHVHDEHCGHLHHSEDDGAMEAVAQPASAQTQEGAGEATEAHAKRAEYRPLAERRVRLGLVLAEIGRRNNLRVTSEELAKAMMAEARRFPGQEQAVLDFLRKNADAKEALAAPLMEEKVVDFILEMADVQERRVSAAELLHQEEDDTTSA